MLRSFNCRRTAQPYLIPDECQSSPWSLSSCFNSAMSCFHRGTLGPRAVWNRFLRRPLSLPGERILRRHAALLFRFDLRSQRHAPKFLSPQAAATPNSARKATPTARSTAELLLQAWSTAIAQTQNSPIAPTARILKNTGTPSPQKTAGQFLSCSIAPECAVTRITSGQHSARLSDATQKGFPTVQAHTRHTAKPAAADTWESSDPRRSAGTC
jgi:hypothetical protein